MAYHELIKNFNKVRSYMRAFFVYGFWHRDQYEMKSARSYDNERRRVESWLGDYVSSRQEPSGKVVYLSVDSRSPLGNPFYKAFKAKSFTANDIMIHFYVMDILADGEALTVREILQRMSERLACFETDCEPDESTLRKKLKEYENLGLLSTAKKGRTLLYSRRKSRISLQKWKDPIAFYSEADCLGVVGSFLMDKMEEIPDYYRFKHRFLLHALDSEVMCAALEAMCGRKNVLLTMQPGGQEEEFHIHPLKIYISTQTGRQYLLGWDEDERPLFFRLDHIEKVKILKGSVTEEQQDVYRMRYEQIKDRLWGVSLGDGETLEHVEMTVRAEENEEFILQRLEREKRCGTVEKTGVGLYRFSADVFDAREMLPWFRTFIGRIVSLECSNPGVLETFYDDLDTVYRWYGGDGDDLQ